jgi:hypothetical protein
MPEADVELVRVYECSNPALVPIVESLLNDAEIVFMKKGDQIQDLLGWGRFGTGTNYATGPIEFWVRSDEEAEARELLTTLEEETPE